MIDKFEQYIVGLQAVIDGLVDNQRDTVENLKLVASLSMSNQDRVEALEKEIKGLKNNMDKAL